MGRHFSKVRGPRSHWAPQTKKSGAQAPPPPVPTPMAEHLYRIFSRKVYALDSRFKSLAIKRSAVKFDKREHTTCLGYIHVYNSPTRWVIFFSLRHLNRSSYVLAHNILIIIRSLINACMLSHLTLVVSLHYLRIHYQPNRHAVSSRWVVLTSGFCEPTTDEFQYCLKFHALVDTCLWTCMHLRPDYTRGNQRDRIVCSA